MSILSFEIRLFSLFITSSLADSYFTERQMAQRFITVFNTTTFREREIAIIKRKKKKRLKFFVSRNLFNKSKNVVCLNISSTFKTTLKGVIRNHTFHLIANLPKFIISLECYPTLLSQRSSPTVIRYLVRGIFHTITLYLLPHVLII